MDIFRVFDALNDPRNLEKAISSVKKYGGHAQGTISYTTSPVHTVEAYVALAKEQESMGIDSLAIKDMAGILTPGAARELVGALVKALPGMPIQMHSHMTSGMAAAMYLAAVESGAGCIDTAISTMSSFSSQPPCESMVACLESEGFSTGLDQRKLAEINAYFQTLKKTRQPPSSAKVEPVDAGVLVHAIPGGMISNLRSQLAAQDALDRLPEVLEELPKTRADMGYPPLVTPTSQIVGVQSVLNVLSGKRYSMVTDETKHYAAGYYGRTPAPIEKKLRKKLMGGLKPIDCRPADLLKPGLAAAAREIPSRLIKAEEDILSYCLFPEVALGYFKWRAQPDDAKDPIPADVEEGNRDQGTGSGDACGEAADAETVKFAEIGRAFAALLAACGGTKVDLSAVKLQDAAAQGDKAPSPSAAPAAAQPKGTPVVAPLNGTFYRSAGPGKPELAKDGATVKAGEPCCIVEAMKLFNPIKTTAAGVITFVAKHGASVAKGETLAVIS
jgi:oxaloacetate decarboxylase alpha subunit